MIKGILSENTAEAALQAPAFCEEVGDHESAAVIRPGHARLAHVHLPFKEPMSRRKHAIAPAS